MATSGTFTGARGGTNGYGPWLTLHWSRIAVDTPGNRSQLRLTLTLHSDRELFFSASKTGTLEGQSFTYSGGFSGTGSVVVRTQDMWFNHDDAGNCSVVLDGVFNIAVSWAGVWVSSISVSDTATIDAIARSSDFTAFSLANSVLNTSTATTINYTTDKKSASFTDHLTLKYGNTTIATWSTTSEGALTRSLTAAEVNAIISAMPTVTSGTLTLILQTKDGTTNIGSSKSRTASISLNSAIAPTASSLVASIFGSGRDKTINKYVQSISKVTSSFTAAAGYGATVSTTTITVKRQSDGGNSQTISGTSGTTANPVTLSGTYLVEAYVKDSRGRTKTASITITVHAYSAPRINAFSTARSSITSTSVLATIDVSWSLAADNPTDIKVVGVNNVGTSVTLRDTIDSTAGSLAVTDTYASQSDTSSYEYIITVTDSFGKKATAKATVGTTFVEVTIAKGKGIGVGKVWEQGALDVGGEGFISSNLDVGGQIKVGGATLVRHEAEVYGRSVIVGTAGSSIALVGGESRANNMSRYLNDDENVYIAAGGSAIFLETNADNTDTPKTASFNSAGTFAADKFEAVDRQKTAFNGVASYENIGHFYNHSDTSTGQIVIVLKPKENIMLSFEVTIRSYGGVAKYIFEGYTYTASTNWYLPSAVCLTSNRWWDEIPIRFATTSDGFRCVVLGNTSSSWGGYLHVSVDRASVGYGNSANQNRWDVMLATSDTTTSPTTVTPRTLSDSGTKGVLWTGDVYLNDTQGVTPSKTLSSCENGWILVWGDYNPPSTAGDSDYQYTYIPKNTAYLGKWHMVPIMNYITDSAIGITGKAYSFDNTKIWGHGFNDSATTDNTDVVLKAVYEY